MTKLDRAHTEHGETLTFLLQDDRDHIRVVVSNGHVERGLQGHAAGVLGERLLRLQVRIGPLLKQLCGQACQATAARRVERALPLDTDKALHQDPLRNPVHGHPWSPRYVPDQLSQ